MSDPRDTEQPADDTDADALQPEPVQPELPQVDPDAPESPPVDDAPQSDEDAAYKDDAGAAFVETVKTKANGR